MTESTGSSRRTRQRRSQLFEKLETETAPESLIEISRSSSAVEYLASAPSNHVSPRTFHLGYRVVLETFNEVTRKLAALALVGRKLECFFEDFAGASGRQAPITRSQYGGAPNTARR
jgi:hypothetical protein